MTDFGYYLGAHGIYSVSSFAWNGALFRAIKGTDAPAYAGQLKAQYCAAREAGAPLSIVAKSLGALIAERALHILHHEIEIDLFLRVGVPDSRTALPLPNVSRIVNVTSSSDRLRKLGLWFIPRLLPDDVARDGVMMKQIGLEHLSHAALTKQTRLGDGDTTYGLYLRLLRGEIT